jgi:hypothetical protein
MFSFLNGLDRTRPLTDDNWRSSWINKTFDLTTVPRRESASDGSTTAASSDEDEGSQKDWYVTRFSNILVDEVYEKTCDSRIWGAHTQETKVQKFLKASDIVSAVFILNPDEEDYYEDRHDMVKTDNCFVVEWKDLTDNNVVTQFLAATFGTEDVVGTARLEIKYMLDGKEVKAKSDIAYLRCQVGTAMDRTAGSSAAKEFAPLPATFGRRDLGDADSPGGAIPLASPFGKPTLA